MRVYDGGNWIAASSAGGASLDYYNYTATASQTTFSGADENGNTLSYTIDNIIVTLNGVMLENGTDYTATNGTSIVLASGAAVDDELNIIAFKSFTTADMVSATNGGTFAGTVNFSSDIVVSGTITGSNISTNTLDDVTDRGATTTNSITVGGLHVNSTDALEMPSGTTAERPSGVVGMTRFNTTTSYLEVYDGTIWYPAVPPIPDISLTSGAIVETITTTLVFSGNTFTLGAAAGTFNFVQASDAIDVDVTSSTPSGGTVSVTIPSSIYDNVTAGNDVSVTFTNEYGLESNTLTLTVKTLPTGGTITTSGGYRIHTFTTSGTFTANHDVSVEYLVVAGGGSGGGAYYGGGGGAGGYRCSVSGENSGGGVSAESPLNVSPAAYTVTVGAGGVYSSNGNDSVFSSITSIGGGKQNSSGGSGGGSNNGNVNGYGTAGQGYNGSANTSNAGGGGGGAGEAGKQGNASSPQSGGAGVSSSITGSAVTRGGGGAGAMNAAYGSYHVGLGGAGGGGNAAADYSGTTVQPQNGTANTGGGGGAGCWNNTSSGANGGSGIVIIRYAV
jgi:hypothetical protein